MFQVGFPTIADFVLQGPVSEDCLLATSYKNKNVSIWDNYFCLEVPKPSKASKYIEQEI